MDIKEYQLVNNKYKITYDNGDIEFMPKNIFEKTGEYSSLQLLKAKKEFFNAFLETWLGKFSIKVVNKLNCVLFLCLRLVKSLFEALK